MRIKTGEQQIFKKVQHNLFRRKQKVPAGQKWGDGALT